MAARAGEHKPTIEIIGGKARIVRVSVSQIKTFARCPRAWWYEKRAKLPKKPMGKGAALGDACHGRIEHYLTTGEDVRGNLERIGAEMLDRYVAHAPFMGGRGLVEAAIHEPAPLLTPGGVAIIGYVDFALPPGCVERHAVIIDHKFRKDVEQYAETEEELADDAQAIVYAAWAIEKWDVPTVEFRHHNHQTQGRRYAKPVSVILSAKKIVDGFDRLTYIVDHSMQDTASKKRDLDVACNEESCSMFGGCDFLNVCPNAPARRFALKLIPGMTCPGVELEEEKNTMGLLDTMRATMGAPPAVPPQAPAPQAPTPAAPQAPAAPAQVTGLYAANAQTGGLYMMPTGTVARFDGAMGGFFFFADPSGNPVRLTGETVIRDVTTDEIARRNFGLPSLIPVAPAAPAAPPAPQFQIPAGQVQVGTLTSSSGRQVAIVETAPAPVNPPDATQAARNPAEQAAMAGAGQSAPASQAPAAPAGEAPKRGPGRPKGSGKKTATEAVASGEATAHAAGLDQGLVLIVDATPSRPAMDLTPYVADLAYEIAKSANLPDVRFAPKDSPLSFGAWRGAMAAAALRTPPDGLCVIHSGELADPVIEALSGVASLVIRGSR